LALSAAALSSTLSGAPAQGTAGGRGGRPQGPKIRIEATSYLKWNKAPIDQSHGVSTYWIHISAAGSNGRCSGGFNIDAQPRILGTVSAIEINGIQAGQPGSDRPPAPGKPSVARLKGICKYEGRAYDVEIDLVGDAWKAGTTPGARGASVRGSIHLKLIETGSKTVSEASSTGQSGVMIWLR
jgi:hypothetical protein